MSNTPEIAFNKKLAQFIDCLITMCPSERSFGDIKKTCEMAANLDHRMIRPMFYEYVTKRYTKQLKARDESFFFDDAVYDKQAMQNEGYDLDIVAKLSNVWKGLTEDDKLCIWNYCDLLMQLSTP